MFGSLCASAYCRNSVDGLWYSYDDISVNSVPEAELCTRGAYILFYQRRDIIPQWSAHSSVGGTQREDAILILTSSFHS